MAKNQAVWALDIGQSALKALKLVPGDSPDQVVAEAFDFVEYPKILSQPDADPEALLVREALEHVPRAQRVEGIARWPSPCRARPAWSSSSSSRRSRRSGSPTSSSSRRKQQIPFALEEVVWAYQQIGDEEEDADEEDFTMAEVGLFAMKRDQINRAILPVPRPPGSRSTSSRWARSPSTTLLPSTRSRPRPPRRRGVSRTPRLDAGAEKQPGKGGDKGSIVLLDIGADNTDLIITDGTRIWQRNVPIGGNHFTRALTKELKLTFAKAEHLKRNATKAPDPTVDLHRDAGCLQRLRQRDQPLDRLLLERQPPRPRSARSIGLGNGFKLPGLQKFLQQNLNGNWRSRSSRTFFQAGRRRRQERASVPGKPSFVRRRLWPGCPGAGAEPASGPTCSPPRSNRCG